LETDVGKETEVGTQNEATREIDGASSEGDCFPPKRYPFTLADRLERLLAWRNREAAEGHRRWCARVHGQAGRLVR
jgi:hypothetical protein